MSSRGIPGTGVFAADPIDSAGSSDARKDKYKIGTRTFLDSLPTTSQEWTQKKRDSGLSTTEQLVYMCRQLTLSDPSGPSSKQLRGKEIVQRYVSLEAKIRAKVGAMVYSQNVLNYTLVLLHCVCLVAREKGDMRVSDIDNMLKGSDDNSVYRMRLRRAARLAAKVIDDLEEDKGTTCSQLFLLYGPSMETYRKWTDSADISKYITDEFKIRCKSIFQDHPNDTLGLSFSPACLLSSFAWTRDEVNTALGTKLSQERLDQHCMAMAKLEQCTTGSNSPPLYTEPARQVRPSHETYAAKGDISGGHLATDSHHNGQLGSIESALRRARGGGIGF